MKDETDFDAAPTVLQRVPKIIRHKGWRGFLIQSKRYAASRAFGGLRARYAYPRFKRRIASLTGIDDALDFLYSFRPAGVSISPYQHRQEIEGLARRVQEIKPDCVVEIGTGGGGSLFLFCLVSSPDATLVSVDLPPSFLGRGYPKWRESIYESFTRGAQKMALIRGDSHDQRTLSLVRKTLADKSVDVLFIDGDHTYEGVKRDFELYSPLVKSPGLVAFHDITPNLLDKEVEVPKFWNEIRRNYRHEEIVFEGDEAGIGVLYL